MSDKAWIADLHTELRTELLRREAETLGPELSWVPNRVLSEV